MAFSWTDYLALAQDLARTASSSTFQDAAWRSAVSRAYYAAFHCARLYLIQVRHETIPETGEAHAVVPDTFAAMPDQAHQIIAEHLRTLRRYRRMADYHDFIISASNLSGATIPLAQKVVTGVAALTRAATSGPPPAGT